MRLFVSYRRADTANFSGRLADRLRLVPGIADVFLDTRTIAPGTDFLQRIDAAIDAADVALIVIGPAWADPERHLPRLHAPDDPVRHEVARCLARVPTVIPIQAMGAAMPAPAALPPDLARLAAINALPIRHESFDRDFAELLAALPGLPAPAPPATGSPRPLLAAALGLAAGIALTLLAAILHHETTGRGLDESLGSPVLAFLMAALPPLAGTAAGLRLAARRR
jgi:hypothetical protein